MASLHQLLFFVLISSLQTYGVLAEKCYRPEIPALTSITPRSDTYQSGDTVTYRCTDRGTPTGGDIRRTCSSRGQWTGVAPLCLAAKDAKVCGIPPQAPLTKSLLSSNKKPGDGIQQECVEGYGPVLRSRCVCMDTGRWDDHCHSSVSCQKNPDPPTNPRIRNYRDACVEVKWDRPSSYTSQTYVEMRCLNSTHSGVARWGGIITSSSLRFQCSFAYYTSVSCDLRAIEGGKRKSTVISTPTITLPCGQPYPPRNLSFSKPKNVLKSGRKIWEYTVSWQPPQYLGCDSLHKYPYDVRYPTDKSPLISLRTTSTVVYADGNQVLKFTVWARGTDSKATLSEPTTQTIRTPALIDIPAEPTLLELTAISSTCVRLSWTYTELNTNTGFQHRCLQSQWTATGLSSRSTTQCGFRPYQEVTCDVRTVNGNLYSSVTSSAATKTSCSAPSAPRGIKFSGPVMVPGSGRKRWTYTVSWKAPTEINCAHLHQNLYIVKHPTTSSRKVEINSTSLVLYADWNEEIRFSVWAKNSDGLVSTPSTIYMDTPKKDATAKDKQECPKVLTAVADPATGRGLIEPSLVGTYLGISFPIGKHPLYFTLADGVNCSSTAIIYDYNLIRRLEFKARYALKCSILNNVVTRQLIATTLKQNYVHIIALCKGVCAVSDTFYPPMTCQNNTLTVRWPTTTTYKADVTELPPAVESHLKNQLSNPIAAFSVVIMTHVPPIVYPIRNNDGSSARVILRSECKNNRLYNPKTDMCED